MRRGDPVEAALAVPALRDLLLARLLLSPLSGWLRRLCDEGGHARQLMEAIAVLQSDFAGEISMEALAQRVGMSPASFFRHFRRFTGTTPLQYLKALHLMKARQLLASTSLPVSSVAWRVGYQSASQFSRDYRRRFNECARHRTGGDPAVAESV